jgi:hypothetical protein
MIALAALTPSPASTSGFTDSERGPDGPLVAFSLVSISRYHAEVSPVSKPSAKMNATLRQVS